MSTTTPTLAAAAALRTRRADALGRLPGTSFTSGIGAVTGWTACPLCQKDDHDTVVSRKVYSQGRGLAAHLNAVHVPWRVAGTKAARKKRKRLLARAAAEQNKRNKKQQQPKNDIAVARDDGDKELEDNDQDPLAALETSTWEPTEEEQLAWEERVRQLVADAEANADETVVTGVTKQGHACPTYRASLPAFLQAAADGRLGDLHDQVARAETQGGSAAVAALLTTRDRHLSTALHWAAGGGHLGCLQYLMGLETLSSTTCRNNDNDGHHHHQTEQNAADRQTRQRRRDGKTCLHYAARNGHVACLEYLLGPAHGQAVDITSGDGTTPLHLACFGGHLEALVCLVQHGASLTWVNDWECGAAHWTGMTQQTNRDQVWALCRYLLAAGVDFTTAQGQGHTPLHKAALKLNPHVITWLWSPAADGGAGLTFAQKQIVALPDQGNHVPSDIWISAGGSESFAQEMRAHQW